MKKQFTIFWLSGKSEIIVGNTIKEAFTNAGYGAGALKAVDFYADGDETQFYEWNTITQTWDAKKQNCLKYAYIYILGSKYKALLINQTDKYFYFICPVTKRVISRSKDRSVDFVSFFNSHGCVNLYKCKHCGADKKTETGLCSNCGKFPADVQIINKKEVEEKLKDNYEKF